MKFWTGCTSSLRLHGSDKSARVLLPIFLPFQTSGQQFRTGFRTILNARQPLKISERGARAPIQSTHLYGSEIIENIRKVEQQTASDASTQSRLRLPETNTWPRPNISQSSRSFKNRTNHKPQRRLNLQARFSRVMSACHKLGAWQNARRRR
jgi:hypothetical protein